jgi:glucoamylase
MIKKSISVLPTLLALLFFLVSFIFNNARADQVESGPIASLKVKPVLLKNMRRQKQNVDVSKKFSNKSNNSEATDGPGIQGVWSRPDKEGFLAVPKQDVRATIAEGILTEVEYPTIDRAQTRDTQLVFIVNGVDFLEERKNFEHQITRYPHSLAYHVSSKNQALQIKIEKDIVIDPDRPVVVVSYNITTSSADTKIYVLHNPAADNTAGGDASFVNTNVSATAGTTLNATSEILSFQSDRRGDEPSVYQKRTIQLLVLDRVADYAGTGFEGVNDPWTRLVNTKNLDNWFMQATNGNVSSALGINPQATHIQFELALAMNIEDSDGSTQDKLRSLASGSLQTPITSLISNQQSQWQSYLSNLNDLGRKDEVHMLVMKSLEDKNFKGSIVAGPTIPSLPDRIEALETDYESARLRTSDVNAGYRRVWIRDAFQMGLALLAGGDTETPLNVARHFKMVQKPDGHFPQNTWVDRSYSWLGFQSDQTGFPIILVSRLVELGLANYQEFRTMVLNAADALVKTGALTGQERWEENGGYSPNSIAIACQGLLEASWLEKNFDQGRAQLYSNTCAQWRNSLLQWTFIESGPLGQGYFERIEVAKPYDVSHRTQIFIGNSPSGGSYFPENEIIDGGFVQWMLSGLVAPNDRHFASSLEVYDRSAVTSLNGSTKGYLRYNHDGYGINHIGRSWPLLSGERALAALYQGTDPNGYRDVMMASQGSGGLMPEQTGVSACPLGWAHAEVLLVDRSLNDNRSFYTSKHAPTFFQNK